MQLSIEQSKTDSMENGNGFKKASRSATVSVEKRQAMIAEAAYYRAEHRGFQGGDTVRDWLAAESEVAERLNQWRVIWSSPKIMVLKLG